MHEKVANQVVAEAICSTMRWDGREFRLGEGVALLDGKVVAVGENLEAALRALRVIDPDPKRGMVFEVAPLRVERIGHRFGVQMTAMNLSKPLEHLWNGAPFGPASSEQIDQLEALIGVPLPADYRAFLLEVGGGELHDVIAPCTVPTPFGEHIITCLHTVEEVINLLDSTVTPRNMIGIGYGHFGRTTCLSVAGLDHGQVFSLDTEMRYYWDEETLSRYPHLDPTIREFFRLRDADELPERAWGYDNCYHVADSFTEFVSKMRLINEPARPR